MTITKKMVTHPAIFQHGMDAHDRGVPLHKNPYPDDADKHHSWKSGWVRSLQIDQHDLEEYRKDQET